MANKNHHVVPHDGQWAVRKAGSSRISSSHRTQKAAIDAAIPRAKSDQAEVVIHDRQGRIRDKDSYGNDPNPPKDRKH